jgi:RNA polymerase sigma-70 factor (ECF subfamily)
MGEPFAALAEPASSLRAGPRLAAAEVESRAAFTHARSGLACQRPEQKTPELTAEAGAGTTGVAPPAVLPHEDEAGLLRAAVGTATRAARPVPAHVAAHDAESRDWLLRLSGEGRERERAVEDLHALLVKAARFTLATRRSALPEFPREALEDLATEAAGEALMAILAHLDDYRGESRFTTWAWKFAFFQSSVAVRRRSWMEREIPVDSEGWAALDREVSLEPGLEERELLAAVQRAVERELTPHQRMVFVALALNGVPVDVLAERMGTTRGALYKTLHDARHKLRAHLGT